jgi:hypothetical protein
MSKNLAMLKNIHKSQKIFFMALIFKSICGILLGQMYLCVVCSIEYIKFIREDRKVWRGRIISASPMTWGGPF